MDTIELDGRTFKVEVIPDDSMGAPWDEHDGHGVVSDWTRREKRPGERVLCSDRDSHRYYDIAETMKLARKDGWGLEEEALAKLADRLGRKPTKREITAAAVEQDFDRLRRWCEGDWYWVGVAVTLLDDEGEETDERDSLWGIESDCEDYLEEVASELAEEILSRVNEETAEREHWAARDVRTV